MSFQEQVLDLMAIKKPCIQIRTNLEKEVLPTLLNILYSNDIDTIYRIDELDKVEKLSISKEGTIIKQAVEDEEFGPIQFNPMMLLPFVRRVLNNKDTEKSAFIFMDYDVGTKLLFIFFIFPLLFPQSESPQADLRTFAFFCPFGENCPQR